MASLTDQQRQFLDNPYAATVTTLRQDGSPHSTIVWIDTADGQILFNTATGRAKERHLRNDPRVSVLVVDPQDQYKWVSITGRAELTTDGADDEIDKLAKKYLGEDKYPWRSAQETRINVVITPEKVDSAGFSE
jgi:PPOX class probable F420-dependent enzyme